MRSLLVAAALLLLTMPACGPGADRLQPLKVAQTEAGVLGFIGGSGAKDLWLGPSGNQVFHSDGAALTGVTLPGIAAGALVQFFEAAPGTLWACAPQVTPPRLVRVDASGAVVEDVSAELTQFNGQATLQGGGGAVWVQAPATGGSGGGSRLLHLVNGHFVELPARPNADGFTRMYLFSDDDAVLEQTGNTFVSWNGTEWSTLPPLDSATATVYGTRSAHFDRFGPRDAWRFVGPSLDMLYGTLPGLWIQWDGTKLSGGAISGGENKDDAKIIAPIMTTARLGAGTFGVLANTYRFSKQDETGYLQDVQLRRWNGKTLGDPEQVYRLSENCFPLEQCGSIVGSWRLADGSTVLTHVDGHAVLDRVLIGRLEP